MTAPDKPMSEGDPKVQLRAAAEWTIADFQGPAEPAGVDRLYLMVTAVFDQLTAGDEPVRGADV